MHNRIGLNDTLGDRVPHDLGLQSNHCPAASMYVKPCSFDEVISWPAVLSVTANFNLFLVMIYKSMFLVIVLVD